MRDRKINNLVKLFAMRMSLRRRERSMSFARYDEVPTEVGQRTSPSLSNVRGNMWIVHIKLFTTIG